MSAIDLTKTIAKAVVGTSVSFSVANLVRNNVGDPEKTYQKVEIFIGSVAMGYVAAEAAENYIDRKIDKMVDWWKENITEKTSK